MAFRTNKPVECSAFGANFILPDGSKVIMVKGLNGGLSGDGFAAGNVRQLKELSGNTHDPVYRYLPIAACDVEEYSGNANDVETLARITEKQRDWGGRSSTLRNEQHTGRKGR